MSNVNSVLRRAERQLWRPAAGPQLADTLKLVDGTLPPVLPRMHGAIWHDDQNRVITLHLTFKVLRQAGSSLVLLIRNKPKIEVV